MSKEDSKGETQNVTHSIIQSNPITLISKDNAIGCTVKFRHLVRQKFPLLNSQENFRDFWRRWFQQLSRSIG